MKQIIVFTGFIVICLLSAAFLGRMWNREPRIPSGWDIVIDDSPWQSYIRKAPHISQTIEGAGDLHTRHAWLVRGKQSVLARWKPVDHQEFADRAVAYLAEIGVLQNWPVSTSAEEGEIVRTPPCQLLLVSIEPSIIVMIPRAGNAVASPPVDRYGLDERQAIRTASLDGGFYYGTEFVSEKSFDWFSPDLPRPPTSADPNSESLLVHLHDSGLHFKKTGNKWQVDRIE